VERNQADSGLFEMLVAVLWAKNGWKDVELIPPAPPAKTPDIKAASLKEEWFVECKRLYQSSGYSRREREKWLTMWRLFRGFLSDNQLPYVLDIVFHVELESLPDEFLRDELSRKLGLAAAPCKLISNETWDIDVSLVNLRAVQAQLRRSYVKLPSGRLNELIGGRRDPGRGFTSMFKGEYVRMGSGRGCNIYVDSLDFAAGAFWHCDAERAIEQKARDIRRHLAAAIEQLPANAPCAVHVGLETLDGWPVEAERYARIINTVYSFDSRGKDLRWIYCHLFQPYAPPDQAWVYDETVYNFSYHRPENEAPLQFHPLTVSFDQEPTDGVHWLRDAP